jgi:polar amino acid transport system ATP-binding protein
MKLELRSVAKRYGDHAALAGVDLALDCRGALVLIGPSGSGKSTLLRLIGGLEPADAGAIVVNGRALGRDEAELLPYRRRIGTVFQAFNLFPHLTAEQNIALPLEKVHGIAREDALATARTHLARFHLAEHARKTPAQLSGGQRQRVAIARAVSIKPDLLLLDEPTSALDPEMTAEVLEMIAELRSEGRDLVLVTHQMAFAREVAGHAVFLARGRVIESAAGAGLFTSPRDGETARFLARVLRY